MSHQNSFAEEEATQICYPKSQSMFEKYLANRIRLRQGAHTPDTGNRYAGVARPSGKSNPAAHWQI